MLQDLLAEPGQDSPLKSQPEVDLPAAHDIGQQSIPVNTVREFTYSPAQLSVMITFILICTLVGIYVLIKKPSKAWQEKTKLQYEKKEKPLSKTEKDEASRKLKESKIMAHERVRTYREAYKIKPELGSYLILPLILAAILLIIGIILFIPLLKEKAATFVWSEHWRELICFAPIVFIGLAFSYLESLKTEWHFILECKKKIYSEQKDYLYYYGYEPNYVYTDYEILLFIANFFKTVIWIVNALIIGIICGGVLYWVSTMSPIVILLSVIAVLLYLIYKKMGK